MIWIGILIGVMGCLLAVAAWYAVAVFLSFWEYYKSR